MINETLEVDRTGRIMDDTISRKAAIDALGEKPLVWEQGEYEEGLQTQWESDVEAIKALPSEQSERKKGKWIKYEQEFMLEGHTETVQKTVRECSICTAKIAGMVGIMNYCPNCGADMREDALPKPFKGVTT